MKTWQPLLTGDLAERAWKVVDEIAAALAAHAATLPPAGSDEPGSSTASAAGEGYQGPSVAGGTAGEALFFAYRSRSGRGDAADLDRASELLDHSTAALATMPLAPDLYGGFSGVAWTAEHLYGPHFADPPGAGEVEEAGNGAEEEDVDPLADIDAALLSFIQRQPWTFDYDLIRGLAGFAVYGLERLPHRSALDCLTAIVDRFEETAERQAEGITWFTAADLLPDWQRQLHPGGYYNLGVAHGVPAVAAVLAATSAAATRLAAANDAGEEDRAVARRLAERSHALAEASVQWLMAQQLPAGEASCFGSTFSRDAAAAPSRLAWCYGDPGIASTLLVAARACGEPAWEALALDIAHHSAQRAIDGSVRDAGLCHGAAGLGHLFNRLYQETGDEALAAASRAWFEKALDQQQAGVGVAGYRAFWMADNGSKPSWRDETGFLEGAAGIGLAFLGGLSAFEPAWDRLLLLSVATAPKG